MKLIRCNGKLLEVRDVGDVVLSLIPLFNRVPLPVYDVIMDDDMARAEIRTLLDSGNYGKP